MRTRSPGSYRSAHLASRQSGPHAFSINKFGTTFLNLLFLDHIGCKQFDDHYFFLFLFLSHLDPRRTDGVNLVIDLLQIPVQVQIKVLNHVIVNKLYLLLFSFLFFVLLFIIVNDVILSDVLDRGCRWRIFELLLTFFLFDLLLCFSLFLSGGPTQPDHLLIPLIKTLVASLSSTVATMTLRQCLFLHLLLFFTR